MQSSTISVDACVSVVARLCPALRRLSDCALIEVAVLIES